ncbi:MAG: succinylglutamate desuccinylase/aspartoacylase family protein [Planctomycetaceae bacterium]
MNRIDRKKKFIDDWDGEKVFPGESRDIALAVSESYSGVTLNIPLHVRRGLEDGPVVFITAALHGDEINGTGAVRALLTAADFKVLRGSVILVPVVNLMGFEQHSRYLPDRRDLNRSFPGSSKGSLASRMARVIFDEIVVRSDFGIDLHTASIRRTNYPNIRGDMTNAAVRGIATAFGCELIVAGRGPRGALRREATAADCPTIVIEGGEVWKVEPAVVETSVRGIRNVLSSLAMIDGYLEAPPYQVVIHHTKWVRAENGGFLQFHVKPGDVVEKGQPLTTNTDLLGHELGVMLSPFDAVVIGLTTIPAVSPGEPVCHLGELPSGTRPESLRRLRQKEDGLENRLVDALSSNVMVVEREAAAQIDAD